MSVYFIIKVLHIISATILFGTGIGIAFFMFRSLFTDNMHEKYFAAKNTVLADYFFTLPAVILQPATGFYLVLEGGFNWSDYWLVATYTLYAIAGLCWLPVVWLQIQLKRMIQTALHTNSSLPPAYYRYFRIWFILGWPAFGGLVYIFYLMVVKPV